MRYARPRGSKKLGPIDSTGSIGPRGPTRRQKRSSSKMPHIKVHTNTNRAIKRDTRSITA